MRRRAMLLVMTVAVAVVVAACGRATQQEIEQALGITPTATLSAGEIATRTAVAAAQASARAAAAASPGGGGNLAALGDIATGQRTFNQWCLQCHRPAGGGRAPALQGAGNPATTVTDAQIADLIRNGTNHTPPGPYKDFQLTDQRINDIIAYLRSVES